MLKLDGKILPHDKNLDLLALAAIGIVFGDIGTSPLYTLKTVIDLSGGKPTPENVLGLLSLLIWTLLVTVSLKYVTFVMRADNDGEGGIMALMSLLRMHRHHRPLIIALGLLGASLIYGDGAITPAISVLSAVEGLKMTAPNVATFVLPISVAILLTLFAVQSQGTARIGWVFGPIMTVWFLTIGILGLWGIAQHPSVLFALNPWHGLHYLFTNGPKGFLVLGGVFLAVTGAEALYADMGQFGAAPIRLAWYGLVFPSLILNYIGQAALLMSGGPISDNIFYQLCPQPFLLALIILATIATVIASQSIITGAYSMTRQAIQLGFCPRLKVTQTSSEGYGQIYIGAVNWVLMFITLGITISFGSSDHLAAAYGIAVSLTMLLTTVLLFVAAREIWKWPLPVCIAVTGTFFCIDVAFFSANLLKVLDGGWVPLVLAIGIYILMWTWRCGSVALTKRIYSMAVPLNDFIAQLKTAAVPRVPGTAVFITKATEKIPPIIIFQVAFNKALHEHVVALSVVTLHTPLVDDDKKLSVECLAPNFWRLIAHYGFMEKPDIPALLRLAGKHECRLDLGDVTYYVPHETIIHTTSGVGLPLWQEKIYAFLLRNSEQIDEFLNLPRERVIEIGKQIEI